MRQVFFALFSGLLVMNGCSRAPDIVGMNSITPVNAAPSLTQHRIFLVTTRAESVLPGEFFSSERAQGLGLASVDVTIPPNHQVGQLERPEEIPPDPLTELTVVDPRIYASDAAYVAEINATLARLPPEDRRLLVFFHGYNNTTSDAILRLGQFIEDADFQGVPILFTWPSAARTPRYVYDLNSALAARSKLKDMADLLLATNARGVDLFAHSMGAFLVMEGLVDAQLSGRLDQRGLIDTIMLASPDIDIDVFRSQVAVLPPAILEKIFVLISEDDQALRISRVIAGGVPRVGAADAEELEALGLTVIDLSEIDDSNAGSHTKFAGSPAVVQLIGAGLNTAGHFNQSASPALLDLLTGVPIQILGN
jgi:esterase/lipase superfamily enzyme